MKARCRRALLGLSVGIAGVFAVGAPSDAAALGVSADPPVVDAASPFVKLQASDSQQPPYTGSIVWYDWLEQLASGSSCNPFPSGATRCLQMEDYVPPGLRTYSASVVDGPPPQTSPGGSSVTVLNPGWVGAVGLTVTQYPGTRYFTFRAEAPKAAFYGISLYRTNGYRVNPGSYTTCNPAAPSDSWCIQNEEYIPNGFNGAVNAFVARDAPSNSFPTWDVRGHSRIEFVSGAPVTRTATGINWTTLESRLNAISDAEIMLIISAAPEATNRDSTISDPAEVYASLRASGVLKAEALRKAAIGLGPASVALLWFVDQALTPGPPPLSDPPAAPSQPTPLPDPGPATVTVPSHTGTYTDDLALEYVRFGRVGTSNQVQRMAYEIPATRATDAATECLKVAQTAISYGVIPAQTSNGKHPCDPAGGYRLYFPTGGEPYPGGRTGTAIQSSQHDRDAIKNHPAWTQLHYVSGSDRRDRGLDRSWYDGVSPCVRPYDVSDGVEKECHEFPYYASAESGPGAALKVIPRWDNQANGQGYSRFVRNSTCPLTSGGPQNPVTPANETGTPFLVIPLPQVHDTPSFFVCDPDQP